MRRRKQDGYKFSDKAHPLSAIISLGTAGAALLVMLVLFIKSGLAGGSAGAAYGVIGILMLLLCAAGLIADCLCFRRREIHYLFPILGAASNGAMLLAYAAVYIAGFIG